MSARRAFVVLLIVVGGLATTALALPDAPQPAAATEAADSAGTAPTHQGDGPRYAERIRVGGDGATLEVRIDYSLLANLPDSGALGVAVVGSADGGTVATTGTGVRLDSAPGPAALARDPTAYFDVTSVWRIDIPALDVTGQGSSGLASGEYNATSPPTGADDLAPAR